MNARRFEHHLDFWSRFLGFNEAPPKDADRRKVTKAKQTLRRLSRQPNTALSR